MNVTRRQLGVPILLVLTSLGGSACTQRPPAEGTLIPQALRAAVADTIRAILTESARMYESAECPSEIPAWFPAYPPYVHFAAEDQVVTLSRLEDVIAYCERLRQGRLSAREEVQDQTVHVLAGDVAYVVTRSLQTTQWQGGRTQRLPVIETAVAARQGGRWRIVYKHLSWRDTAPE